MWNFQEPPDMESENSDELDHVPVDESPNLSQGHESLTAVSNTMHWCISAPTVYKVFSLN